MIGWRTLLVWIASALFVAAVAALIWADVSAGDFHVGETVALASAFSSFFLVGLAIVVRREGHVIGWIFAGVAVYAMTQAALAAAGERVMAEGGGERLYAIANVAFSWPTLLGVMVVLVPLLFPTGHLPSPRWRWLAWLTGVAMAVVTAANTFQRDICVTYDDGGSCLSRIDNPIGVDWIENIEESALGAVLFSVLAICLVGAGISLVFRYRRAEGVERAQLRWFTFSVSLLLSYILVVDILLGDVLGLEAEMMAVMPDGLDPFGILLAFIPISVGLAILRYRLYDIDRIISRTVSYGLVSAVLLTAYAGAVFLLGRMLPGRSDLAVAASTLAIAVLFNPVRRRVQVEVDRRFNRSRYDGERIVERFGLRLRSQVGMDDLSHDLVAAAATTMQPATASLWLRKSTP